MFLKSMCVPRGTHGALYTHIKCVLIQPFAIADEIWGPAHSTGRRNTSRTFHRMVTRFHNVCCSSLWGISVLREGTDRWGEFRVENITVPLLWINCQPSQQYLRCPKLIRRPCRSGRGKLLRRFAWGNLGRIACGKLLRRMQFAPKARGYQLRLKQRVRVSFQ